MKIVNLLGAGAVLAGTLIAAAPAEAQRHGRPGWHHRGSAYGYGHRGYGYRGGYGYRPGYYGHRPGGRYAYRPYGGYRHGYPAYAYRHRGYQYR